MQASYCLLKVDVYIPYKIYIRLDCIHALSLIKINNDKYVANINQHLKKTR
jgi:hypothetical protein